ncbi:MAG: hypothetical protein LH624_19920, partial [Cryobacterium sp.]|nr:hypothetical protein [Cryobacterium sp.]
MLDGFEPSLLESEQHVLGDVPVVAELVASAWVRCRQFTPGCVGVLQGQVRAEPRPLRVPLTYTAEVQLADVIEDAGFEEVAEGLR